MDFESVCLLNDVLFHIVVPLKPTIKLNAVKDLDIASKATHN